MGIDTTLERTMPLLDHFAGPLRRERHWEGFHSVWASETVRHLNLSLLPANYIAEPNVKLGVEVEVDVATLEQGAAHRATGEADNGGVAMAVYAPPQPAVTFAADFGGGEVFEIKIQKEEGGLRLVAAIELVSPGNKDRPGTRQAFVRKCAAYLQENVSLIIVDIVTERSGNFHADLLALLQAPVAPEMTGPRLLYTAAYRPRPRQTETIIEGWPHVLAVGQPLPTLPLWLDADLAVPLDLEETYRAACEVLRLPQ
jgi:Protein of unknown function (DUF4058)